MSTPLRGARIPEGRLLDNWAAEPCELCHLPLGRDHSIVIGHGDMGYQHAVCAVKYAANELARLAGMALGKASDIATEALKVLGREHVVCTNNIVYWPDDEDG